MARSRLFKYFPTPTYLEMPAVGIDVSDRTVRFLEFNLAGPALSIKRFGSRPIPPGSITNGEITNRDGLSAALSSLQKELGVRFINASLPEEKAFLFKTEIPKVERREIRGAIELLLEENVPIKPQEAIFDYEVIDTSSHDRIDVSVSVLPEKTVNDFVDLFRSAGFEPLLFEVDAQATAQAVVAKGDRSTIFIVNIGTTRTTLSVASEGVIYFTSTVSTGGAALTAAFEKQLGVDTVQAEEYKRLHGLVDTKKEMELFFSLMSTLSVLRDEMNRLLSYWQNLRRSKRELADVSHILLAGRDAALPGLLDYFASSMKLPVRVANVWVNVFPANGEVAPIFFEDSLDYATVVGLALPKTD